MPKLCAADRVHFAVMPEIRPIASGACGMCQGTDWWESVFGARVCRSCHAPAAPWLEKAKTDVKQEPVPCASR